MRKYLKVSNIVDYIIGIILAIVVIIILENPFSW